MEKKKRGGLVKESFRPQASFPWKPESKRRQSGVRRRGGGGDGCQAVT